MLKENAMMTISAMISRQGRQGLRQIAAVGLMVLMAVPVMSLAQSGGVYTLTWSTLDGGGVGQAGASSGDVYTVAGTVGQADAESLALVGGAYGLLGGFWVLPRCAGLLADFDADCDVDLADLARLETCARGPVISYLPGLPPGCTLAVDGQGFIAADFDRDGDVDQADFALFQRCITYTASVTDPACLTSP